MKNLYQIAVDGWRFELADRDPFSYVEPEWHQYSTEPKIERDSLRSMSVVFCSWGGASVTINGDVGEGAIILCAGGGARVEVKGNIGKDVRIFAGGGGAEILYHGTVDPTARLFARGGASKVTKVEPPAPVEVMNISVVVDLKNVGSETPYTIVVNGGAPENMDMSDVEREVHYALDECQRRGVEAISEFWSKRSR